MWRMSSRPSRPTPGVSLVGVTHASLAPELPELVQQFAFLLGSWQGEGGGGYPTIDGGDFRYGQEVPFSCPGKPLIAYSSRSWSLDDGRTLSLESGYWRPTGGGEIEVVLSLDQGWSRSSTGGSSPARWAITSRSRVTSSDTPRPPSRS